MSRFTVTINRLAVLATSDAEFVVSPTVAVAGAFARRAIVDRRDIVNRHTFSPVAFARAAFITTNAWLSLTPFSTFQLSTKPKAT